MKKLAGIWLILLPVLWSSCRTDFDAVPSAGNLEFSRDTVYLDTVFSNIGSSTYNLKVYNRSREDISIPEIQLSLGEASRYRLNVDGISGSSFGNIQIPARDSIFIFIETTVDISDLGQTQFLYSDAIEFDSGEHQQKVPLVTLVKDAVFLYPKKYEDGSIETIYLGQDENGDEVSIQGFLLEDGELHFTNEKPYVIYGYAAVPSGKTLKIDPGARIHFHQDSGLIISDGASLQATGAFSEDQVLLEKEIIFEGDRLEPRFSEIPGQWGTIWLRPGSTNNVLDHVSIRNAGIGLWVAGEGTGDASEVTIRNTQIYNSSVTGLLAQNAAIAAENLIINNSGQSSLHITLGGSYSFRHSTFANFWNQGYRTYPAVLIENFLETAEQLYVSDLNKADFSNCIIYGNQDQELLLFSEGSEKFNFSFSDCLIQFEDPDGRFADLPEMDLTDPEFYRNILLNADPLFQNPKRNQLQLTEHSPARDIGNLLIALEVPSDILNTPRIETPDLGAYEWR